MGCVKIDQDEFIFAHRDHKPDNMSDGEVSRITDAAGVTATNIMEVGFRRVYLSFQDLLWNPDNICCLHIQKKGSHSRILEVLKCQDDWFFVRLFYTDDRWDPVSWSLYDAMNKIRGDCWKCDQLGPVLDLIRKARARTDDRYLITYFS